MFLVKIFDEKQIELVRWKIILVKIVDNNDRQTKENEMKDYAKIISKLFTCITINNG